ncbi:single-stranded DNA-binding protein [Futiania mangrovi]|uniref:Single-stranded DNA-binding protein n=1 Tax=Futiania mangrovi TaxID=2959716 RepID=A0A9J6PEF6_9PROT|nr:single-stranded DNA-binding protein [Futiania mangrovii]MCP1336790.1 single-stranded DNA-binding protein [Futiania mangrovii]
MINKVTLLGRLGRDAVIQEAPDGQKYAAMAVATWVTWLDRDTGQRKSRADWHRVISFRKDLLGYLERRAKTGARVYIEGSIRAMRQESKPDAPEVLAILVHRDGTVRILDQGVEQAETPADAETVRQIVNAPEADGLLAMLKTVKVS